MEREIVEGVDVVTCYDAAKRAIDRAREDSLPKLLEFKTYRYRGHSMADPAKYRTKEEVAEWKKRDPLILAEQRIRDEFPELLEKLEPIRSSVKKRSQTPCSSAHDSPDPDPSTVADYTYV